MVLKVEFLGTFLTLFTTVAILLVFYVRHCYNYWGKRKVPFLTPKFPVGNIRSLMPKGIGLGNISYDFYHEFKNKGHRFGGVYVGLDPALVLTDPNDIKNVLIKDFDHFADRGIYMTEKEPISVSMFAQTGSEWKNIRTKFNNIFTTSKMKTFFGIMKECCSQTEEVFEKAAIEKTDVDILEIMACYTTDVIGNVIYGISCNSFKNPNADFRRMGRKLFEEFSFMDRICLFFTVFYPKMSRKLGIRNIQTDVKDFFIQSVSETVAYREKNNIYRQDMLDILIQMKNENNISMNELISQTFLFFAAGYETSSTTATLALYELARRQDIQDKVRHEIHEVLKRHNNDLTYDALAEMKYLQQVLEETMRMWPVLATLTRICEKDYQFPDSDFTVEKGVKILIPVLAMHRDSDFYPDALKWNPDRFSQESRSGGKYLPYFAFGDGPRICIGARFGSMQVRIGLITILKNYRVFLSPNTPEQLELNPETFVLHTTKPIYLRLEKLKN